MEEILEMCQYSIACCLACCYVATSADEAAKSEVVVSPLSSQDKGQDKTTEYYIRSAPISSKPPLWQEDPLHVV